MGAAETLIEAIETDIREVDAILSSIYIRPEKRENAVRLSTMTESKEPS